MNPLLTEAQVGCKLQNQKSQGTCTPSRCIGVVFVDAATLSNLCHVLVDARLLVDPGTSELECCIAQFMFVKPLSKRKAQMHHQKEQCCLT